MIKAVSILRARAQLSRPVQNARLRREEIDRVILRLEDEAGRVGQGEASPWPGYSPGTANEAESALRALDLEGIDPSAPLTQQLSALRFKGPPSALFAVEMALIELAAKRQGCSILQLLGGDGSKKRPVAALLDTLEDAREMAEALFRSGVRTLKLKVGRPGRLEEELALIDWLLTHLDVSLRADANGALEHPQATLVRLAQFGLEFIEEPCDLEMIRAMPPSPVPIALDESLTRPGTDDAIFELAAAGKVAAMVLKPSLLGVRRCLQLAGLARSLGLKVIISHLYESARAHGLLTALAFSLMRPEEVAGLGAHAGMKRAPLYLGPGFLRAP